MLLWFLETVFLESFTSDIFLTRFDSESFLFLESATDCNFYSSNNVTSVLFYSEIYSLILVI